MQSPESSARHREEPSPPALRACAYGPGAGGGREPGRPAARRLSSPALRCLQGGESELCARNTPPPPLTAALTLLSPGPSDIRRSWILFPNCSRVQRLWAPKSCSKITNALRFTPFGTLGISILRPSPVKSLLFSRLSNASHFTSKFPLWLQNLNVELSPAPSLRHCA